MKMLILDVVDRVSPTSGKTYRQAAIRANSKKGPFLFIATVPPDFEVGMEPDNQVCFNKGGSAYVLPY